MIRKTWNPISGLIKKVLTTTRPEPGAGTILLGATDWPGHSAEHRDVFSIFVAPPSISAKFSPICKSEQDFSKCEFCPAARLLDTNCVLLAEWAFPSNGGGAGRGYHTQPPQAGCSGDVHDSPQAAYWPAAGVSCSEWLTGRSSSQGPHNAGAGMVLGEAVLYQVDPRVKNPPLLGTKQTSCCL